MHPRYLLLIILLASSASASAAGRAKARGSVTVNDLVQFVVRKGRDWTLFPKKTLAPLLGLPDEGGPAKALAENGTPAHMCAVVVDKSDEGGKPVCVVLSTSQDFEDNRKTKSWQFRFDLNGTLEKAFSEVGENDDQGHAIEGSAEVSAHDIRDPDIQKSAQQELKFWLARARELMKASPAAAKKAAAKPKKSSPDDMLNELH